MLQQVNLYKHLPQEKRSFLTTKFIFLSYSIFCLLLIFLYFKELKHNHALALQLNNLTTTTARSQQHLNSLIQRYPTIDQAELKKNILQLQKDYADKANTINLLSTYANFSDYLLELGNAIISGIWLTEITFNRNAVVIGLKGYTLQPALLEAFLKQLTLSPVFSHLTFNVNELEQTKSPATFYITAQRVYRYE